MLLSTPGGTPGGGGGGAPGGGLGGWRIGETPRGALCAISTGGGPGGVGGNEPFEAGGVDTLP